MAEKRTISTIREQVYYILRDEICRGVYPAGTRLQEADLTKRLEVSRSPVREALRKLASEGLLSEIPNKGVYVKEFSTKDIEEIFELRVLLESYGIYHSEGHITPERREKLLGILAELETSFRRGDLESYTAADEDLHNQIVHLADNSLVNDTYERVRSMNQQFRVLSLMSSRRFMESLEEHRSIIQNIIEGNLQEADEINRHHLQLACNAIKDRLTH